MLIPPNSVIAFIILVIGQGKTIHQTIRLSFTATGELS